MQLLRLVSKMQQKVFLRKAIEKVSNIEENWRRRANPKETNLFTTRSSKLQGTGCLFILGCRYPTSYTKPFFLKSVFATMGKVLPSESAARACVAKLVSQKEKQIQELLCDEKFFKIVDEAEVAKQKYINVLVGSLDAPNQTFLVDCHPLDSGSYANNSTIPHTVDAYCDNLK